MTGHIATSGIHHDRCMMLLLSIRATQSIMSVQQHPSGPWVGEIVASVKGQELIWVESLLDNCKTHMFCLTCILWYSSCMKNLTAMAWEMKKGVNGVKKKCKLTDIIIELSQLITLKGPHVRISVANMKASVKLSTECKSYLKCSQCIVFLSCLLKLACLPDSPSPSQSKALCSQC